MDTVKNLPLHKNVTAKKIYILIGIFRQYNILHLYNKNAFKYRTADIYYKKITYTIHIHFRPSYST